MKPIFLECEMDSKFVYSNLKNLEKHTHIGKLKFGIFAFLVCEMDTKLVYSNQKTLENHTHIGKLKYGIVAILECEMDSKFVYSNLKNLECHIAKIYILKSIDTLNNFDNTVVLIVTYLRASGTNHQS